MTLTTRDNCPTLSSSRAGKNSLSHPCQRISGFGERLEKLLALLKVCAQVDPPPLQPSPQRDTEILQLSRMDKSTRVVPLLKGSTCAAVITVGIFGRGMPRGHRASQEPTLSTPKLRCSLPTAPLTGCPLVPCHSSQPGLKPMPQGHDEVHLEQFGG